MVYVISKNNKPLMPCENVIARLLLKEGKAKVKNKCPFTIQLTHNSKEYTQDLTLGVDTGSSKIGCAVVDNNENVYYLSETKIRNDISSKMERRKTYRKARRSRKLRYRKARWLNRKNSIKKDRFSPTMISKINSHIREIEFIKSILPISTLVIETGTFDTHLLKHKGEAFNRHWGYQKGPNYGFANAKAACLNRDNYTCQCCKTRKGTLNAHHIVWRSKQGSDELDNLTTLCEKCHKKLHHGELSSFESKLIGKKKGQLKHATQMNSIRVQLLRHYPNAIETYGFITKENRQIVGLEKTHYNDAVIIATGCLNKPTFLVNIIYKRLCVPKGQYQLYQGQNSEKNLPRGKIYGFSNYDKVRYCGKEAIISGRRSNGYFDLADGEGNRIDFSYLGRGYKTPRWDRLRLIERRKTTVCIKEKCELQYSTKD